MIRLFNILFLSFCFSVNLYANAQYCNQFPPEELTPAPAQLPDEFETRVEINLDGNKARDVQQFFDLKERKGAIIIQESNVERRIIFDYYTNEIHVVTSNANETDESLIPQHKPERAFTCQTYPLSGTPDLNYYFGSYVFNTTYVSPNAGYEVLHFRKNFSHANNETAYVRGIPCDVYYSCEYNDRTQSNYTVQYYFSRNNYTLPGLDSKFTRLPVRVVFKGLRPINSVLTPYEEYHDYYHFRARLTRREVFQTPTGVFCKGRKIYGDRRPPNITNQFRFSMEEVKAGQISYLKNLVYDYSLSAIRFEINPLTQEESTFNMTDPLVVVHDYNIGVAFTRNTVLGKCILSPITYSALDEDSVYTIDLFNQSNSFVLKLKSPQSLLQLDSDYIYTGKRFVGGVPAEVFISDRTKFYGSEAIAEYAFSGDEYSVQNPTEQIKNVPISLAINVPKLNLNSYTTYFKFENSSTDLGAFDVTQCFEKDDRIEFRIKYPYKDINPQFLQILEQEFVLISFYTLIGATNESYTRFTKPIVGISSDGNIYARSAILPNPPVLYLFTEVKGKWLIAPALTIERNVAAAEDCAYLCVKNLRCLSFDYGTTSLICYINYNHGSQADLRPSTNYRHFSRNSLNAFNSRPSYEIWDILSKDVSQNKVFLPVLLANGTVQLYATEIEQVLDTNNRQGSTSLLSKYNLLKKYTKFTSNKDRSYIGFSIDDCAKACTDELGFECLSFSFCYLAGDCAISQSYLSDNDADYQSSAECDIYEKDRLAHYFTAPGKATINEKDLQYESINKPADCAAKCDSEKNIHCRSFNYCPDSKKCYLSETHISEGSERETTDLRCQHYSRDYLSDFTYTSTANITLDAELVFEESNLEICSRLCVTADDFNCRSFDFCSGTKKCLLNTGYKTQPVAGASVTARDSCANYKREYFYVTSQKANNSNKKDGSPGLLAALSIAFSLVGLALGLIATLFYLKKRSV